MQTNTCDRPTEPTEAVSIEIRGNTYPVKDQLRSLGCRWNPAGKCWMATPAIADAARAIVAGNGNGSASHQSSGGYRPHVCRQCGARPNARGWPRIYRNGICSDCYRDEKEEREMGY